MSDSLSVVALISGGKDSLYSLLHCIQNGHKVVALANLHPLGPESKIARQVDVDTTHKQEDDDDDEEEDINSFMYQTVGHSIIPLYADALKLPLYRREIIGSAVQTSRDYTYLPPERSQLPPVESSALKERDETEDLIPLLRQVIQNHPEVNAISTGAIQSTYQRTRIESVALRLKLAPLAYLWQYPVLPPPINMKTRESEREDSSTALLDDMAAAGCESRIIKIASGGIKESLLWSDVTSVKARLQLVAGLRKFFDGDELGLRGAVVGEGGEFETLALSGPKILWKGGRILVDDRDIKMVSGEGGTSYVKIGAAKVVAYKADDNASSVPSKEGEEPQASVPGLFDQRFEAVLRAILRSQSIPERVNLVKLGLSPAVIVDNEHTPSIVPTLQYAVSTSSVQIANMTYVGHGQDGLEVHLPSARMQMQLIAAYISELLSEISATHNIDPPLNPSAIVSTMLLLRDMSDFTSINPIYATMFNEGVPIPPARVTIASALPDGIEVMLSFILDLGPRHQRRGLHVQGRSYWAPANIGPYSQAVAVPHSMVFEEDRESAGAEIVHVAGQIPLIPATMNLLDTTFAEQAVLSLQHLWRVGQERRVDLWATGVAFLPHSQAPDAMSERIMLAGDVWRTAHLVPALESYKEGHIEVEEEEEDFDVWHTQHNHTSAYLNNLPKSNGQPLRPLPSQHTQHAVSQTNVFLPAFIAAEVTALPRNAPVEWWSTGLTGIESLTEGQVTWNYLSRTKKTLDDEYFTTMVKDICDDEDHQTCPKVATGMAFVATNAMGTWHHLVTKHDRHRQDSDTGIGKHVSCTEPYLAKLSLVPCHRLWGYKGRRFDMTKNEERTLIEPEQLDIALVIRVDTQTS